MPSFWSGWTISYTPFRFHGDTAFVDRDRLTISVFEENDRAVALYDRAGFMRDILRLVQPLSDR